MKIESEHTIIGRGLIVVVRLENNETVRIGDKFNYKDKNYSISGIEKIKTLEGEIKQPIGLVLKEVKGE